MIDDLHDVRAAVYAAGVNRTMAPREAAGLADDFVRALRPADFWSRWRKCPTCQARIGDACRTVSSTIVNGRPAGMARRLEVPHKHRLRRTV